MATAEILNDYIPRKQLAAKLDLAEATLILGKGRSRAARHPHRPRRCLFHS